MEFDIINLYDKFLNDMSLYRRLGTVECYRCHSLEFIKRFERLKLKKLKEVNQVFINDYIRDLKLRGICSSSINKKIYSILLFYRWLVKNKYIKKIDFTFKKIEELEKPIKALTINDLKIFIDYVEQRPLKQKLIFYLLLTTGIRRNELIHIKLEYLDFTNKRIFLDFTKNHKARYCYLNDYVISLIKSYILENKFNKTGFLFSSSNGRCLIKGTYITQMFYYVKTRIKLNINANMLRHTYATYLLKNGANIEELRALMGHSDYRITKRYVQHLSEELQSANNNFNVLESIKRGY